MWNKIKIVLTIVSLMCVTSNYSLGTTAKTMLKFCTNKNNNEKNFCLGYVSASSEYVLLEVVHVMRKELNKKFGDEVIDCAVRYYSDVTDKQLLDSYVNYILKNPEILERSAQVAFINMYLQKYEPVALLKLCDTKYENKSISKKLE